MYTKLLLRFCLFKFSKISLSYQSDQNIFSHSDTLKLIKYKNVFYDFDFFNSPKTITSTESFLFIAKEI